MRSHAKRTRIPSSFYYSQDCQLTNWYGFRGQVKSLIQRIADHQLGPCKTDDIRPILLGQLSFADIDSTLYG